MTRLVPQAALNPHVEQIIRAVRSVARVRALLLLGSTARGEASYLQLPTGRLELFSDLEFLLVTDRSLSPAQRQALLPALQAVEREIANPNPLFHIDLIVRTRRRLSSLPRIIFTYEMKKNAQVLVGDDVRAEIPTVTLHNLNLRNTREILYLRLWAILLHLPKRLLLGRASEAERRVAGYVCCRNALDLTTVLLPLEGVLLPTYRLRVAYVQEHHADLASAAVLGPAFPAFLGDCLQRRRDLDFARQDLTALYDQTLEYLERGLVLTLPDSCPDLYALPRCSHRVFDEWPISRGGWYNLARLAVLVARRRGVISAARWMTLPKKGWLTLGLLDMHRSLRGWFSGAPAEAWRHLERSREVLSRLAIDAGKTADGDYTSQWLSLRAEWAEFWRQYIRMGAMHYVERFRQVMEWTSE